MNARGDTLSIWRALMTSGFTEGQATAIVDALKAAGTTNADRSAEAVVSALLPIATKLKILTFAVCVQITLSLIVLVAL